MQRNASLFFAEIPDDIGQLAANPDLGQMLVHEESLAFGIANDEITPEILRKLVEGLR